METKKKRQSWDHLNTIEDFNKFIEENDIKCSSDFKKNFRGGYDRARKINILNKLIFPEKRSDWSHLNTPDDFNKFIKENDIKNPKDFKEKFRSGYDRAYKLGILGKLTYPEKQNNWSHLNTLDDFNKFIKENDIKNPINLEKIFNSVYNRARRLGILSKLTYPEKQNNWSYLNTPDDFNKFIKENDIKNPKDFKEKFGSVYTRAYKLDILDKLIYPEKQNNWSYLNTPDDFNKFIKENDIKNPKDFKEKFGSVYDKARRLDILGKLTYPERQNNWKHLNTLDDFNKFIKENNIKNPKELEKNFKGVHTRAQRLGILKYLIYCKGKKEKSSWEVDIYNIIVGISIFINPKREVTFKDCKNKRELPFDIVFSLPNGKIIIIEIQGPRHYTREFGEEKYIPVRKNDLIKYRWAKEQNNVYLFYFSKPNYHLNENSYFHYIYTSEEELLNDIKKLI
jgi:hypothetical protein